MEVLIDVVSPHQDDAAYSLNGALSRFSANGVRLRIINVFTVSDFMPAPSSRSTLEVSRLRATEDRAFASSFSPEIEIVDLGCLDAPVRGQSYDDLRAAGPLSGSSLDEARRVAALLRALWDVRSPALVIAPLSLGGHIDHRIARAATLQSWSGPLSFYEDIPHAALLGSAELEAFVDGLGRQLGESLASTLIGEGGARQIADKFMAASFYRSQECTFLVDGICAHSRLLGGRERLWSRPASLGVVGRFLPAKG
jgi:hypothetical protein